jgi:predicted O-methyltransferase YrrM
MNILEHILKKYKLTFDDKTPMPIEIPNVGRDNLSSLFHEIGFKVGVEIGVLAGEYSEVLCQANPGLKLYGIDPYEAHAGYPNHAWQSSLDKYYEEAKARLAPYKNYEFVKKYSLDAAGDFADNSLDFVYIDGNHDFYNVTADITFWTPKVRPGGIISGHDYFDHKGASGIHVYQVVNAYTEAYGIRPWFALLKSIPAEGQQPNEDRSWLWVKQ